jgi:hypothetical protein
VGWILALNGAFFVIVAWRLWKNSRAWALLGLIVMSAEFVTAQLTRGRPDMFFIVPAILFLAMLNATRGAFAFYKYRAQEKSLEMPEQIIPQSLEPRV